MPDLQRLELWNDADGTVHFWIEGSSLCYPGCIFDVLRIRLDTDRRLDTGDIQPYGTGPNLVGLDYTINARAFGLEARPPDTLVHLFGYVPGATAAFDFWIQTSGTVGEPGTDLPRPGSEGDWLPDSPKRPYGAGVAPSTRQ